MKETKLNQNIDWSRSGSRDRVFDRLICRLAGPGDRVLDLGCGRGDLLLRLKKEKGIRELGIELDPEYAADCLTRGLSVIQGNLEDSIHDFNDDFFDLVILNQVMLTVPNPLHLLKSGLRVGKKVAITFPNFAYWRIRTQIMFRGRLPVNKNLPYEWYETPNIRLATVDDFVRLCREHRIAINQKNFVSQVDNGKLKQIVYWPNLRSSLALFCLSRAQDA